MNELEIFSLDELRVLSSVENCVATFKFIARYFALSFYVQIYGSNLQNSVSNFTHRDPHLENAKFKPATLCASKAMSLLLTCSGDSGGFCLAKLAAAEQTGAGLLLAVASA